MNAINVTTSQFLAALFPTIPEGALIEVRAEQPDGSMIRRWSPSIQELLTTTRTLTESANIWFGPGLRMRRGGTNADIGWITSLWVDADAKLFEHETKEEAYERIMRFRLRPNIIVNSGHGLQPYWLLRDVVEVEEIPTLIGAMRSLNAELSEGLPRQFDAVAQASRMMRLPNTMNRKDPAAPVMARIIHWECEPEQLYSLSDFPVNPINIPTVLKPYLDEEFAIPDDVPPPRELIAEAQARGCIGWAIDALDRPDRYGKGDNSNLDYSIMRELAKHLTVGECEYVWMNTALGQRHKVQQRQDYRRRTIWRARQAIIDKGEQPYTPGQQTETVGIAVIELADDGSRPQNYRHAWNTGLELIGRRTTLLANFRPILLREVEVIHEDGDAQREYEIQLRRRDDDPDPITFRLTTTDVRSERAFRERVAPLLPASFIVYPSGWSHLLPATFELAQDSDYIRERTYASTGWVTDVTPAVFILPGAAGGISAHGLDEQYQFDMTSLKRLPERLKQYGAGVRPTYDSGEREIAESALLSLLSLTAPEVIIPIMTQVMAGPLSSAGARQVPPLVHVLGQTGSFKTTLSLLCLSLFGQFTQGAVPETWTSTQNALTRRLYETRDLTLLIDDYKRMKQEPVSLIQNYADSSTRSRMGSDQENRVTLMPRGMLLSTGEDVWDEHESTEARTIVVNMRRPDANTIETFMRQLTDVQQRAASGHLALVGGDWLAWLSSCGLGTIESAYYERRIAWVEAIGRVNRSVHPRLINSMASLFAVGDMVQQFLENYYPSAAVEFADHKALAWQTLLEGGVERAKEAETRSPYERIIAELQEAIIQREVYFTSRLSGDQITGTQFLGLVGTESVGYFDSDYLYLTKLTTFAWAQRKARRAGQDVPFTWNAFCQGVRDRHGPWMHNGEDQRTSFQLRVSGARVRCVVLPRSLFSWNSSTEEVIRDMINGIVFNVTDDEKPQ